MRFTYAQYLDWLRKRSPAQGVVFSVEPVCREIPLHNQIIDYCNSQWPRWKYIHANPAAKSTIQLGAQDFTIFMPDGATLCIEVKTKNGKRSPEQQQWAAEMQMLGHVVHVVRAFSEFIALVTAKQHVCRRD